MIDDVIDILAAIREQNTDQLSDIEHIRSLIQPSALHKLLRCHQSIRPVVLLRFELKAIPAPRKVPVKAPDFDIFKIEQDVAKVGIHQNEAKLDDCCVGIHDVSDQLCADRK